MNKYDIVVAPYGDDLNIGTAEHPVKTPERAKEILKNLKNTNCGTINVWFREGTYFISDTIEFTSDDKSNVIYRSYPNETVEFTGSKEISGWSETVINGVKAFVTHIDINSDEDYFNSLFKGEKRLPRSVYPKTSAFKAVKTDENDAIETNSDSSYYAAFYAKTDEIMNFSNIHDVDVRFMHYWCDDVMPIANMNVETGRIEVRKPAALKIKAEQLFIYENVRETLSSPGEWYLDRSEEKLYYIPEEGDTTENTVLLAGYTDKLIDINCLSHIHFKGIKFCNTDWEIVNGIQTLDNYDSSHPLFHNLKYSASHSQAASDVPGAIEVRNASKISFTDCEFKNISNTAVKFTSCVTDSQVSNCLFDNIGANAVYIRGDYTLPATTKNITVTDCNIKYYGRIYNNAIGVLLIHAADCEISNNEIHDGWYTAVSVGWVWGYKENPTNNIKVMNNLIYNIGNGWLSDMGGIYTLGIQPDTVISGNIIHNVGCYEGSDGYGGWGIYLDEGSTEITVKNNLAYDCSSQPFHQHYGKNNMIRNNIFGFGGESQFKISKHEEHNSLYLYNNIIVGDNTAMYTKCVDANWFTDNGNLYWDYSNGENVFSEDLTQAENKYTVETMTERGYFNNTVFEDPLFNDVENRDFTLKENSPAFKTGFKAWEYNAGIRKNK